MEAKLQEKSDYFTMKSKNDEAKIVRMTKHCTMLENENHRLSDEVRRLNEKVMSITNESTSAKRKLANVERAHKAMIEANNARDYEIVHGSLDAQRQRLAENAAFKQSTSSIWDDAYASYGDAILPMKENILNAKTKGEAEFQIIKFLGEMARQ